MNPPDRRGFHPIPARPRQDSLRAGSNQETVNRDRLQLVPIDRAAGQNPGSVQVL